MTVEKDMEAVIFDTETTSQEPHKAKIVQLGVLKDNGVDEVPDIIMNSLCDPLAPIPAESSEVHGIFEDDITWAPEVKQVVDLFMRYLGGLTFPVLVGHNINYYDIPVVANVNPDIKNFGFIDTYMMARRMYPEFDSHKLSDVYVSLGGDMDPEGAHNAIYDCVLNHYVFAEMLKKMDYSVEAMWQWSLLPMPFTIMPFGRHKGKKMENVPSGYLRWCEKNFTGIDIDFQETIDVYVHGKENINDALSN